MRVSEDDLAAILDVPPSNIADGTVQLTAFLQDAELIVTETLYGQGMTDSRLAIVQKYIAAHLYTIAKERGGIARDKVGEAMTDYVTAKGSGFHSTHFGTMALGFDTTGLLAQMNTPASGLPARFGLI